MLIQKRHLEKVPDNIKRLVLGLFLYQECVGIFVVKNEVCTDKNLMENKKERKLFSFLHKHLLVSSVCFVLF